MNLCKQKYGCSETAQSKGKWKSIMVINAFCKYYLNYNDMKRSNNIYRIILDFLLQCEK